MGDTNDCPAKGQTVKSAHSAETLEELASEFRRSDDEELSLDELFDLLRNRRRRDILTYLDASDGTVTLDELAEAIAADENDIEPEQLSSQQRKRVYISLYQNHLPKMDDLGLIEYEKNRGVVKLVDISEAKPYLSVDSTEGSTSWPYVAIAVCAVVAVGATGLGPLSVIPLAMWTGVSVAVLFAIAVHHL